MQVTEVRSGLMIILVLKRFYSAQSYSMRPTVHYSSQLYTGLKVMQ